MHHTNNETKQPQLKTPPTQQSSSPKSNGQTELTQAEAPQHDNTTPDDAETEVAMIKWLVESTVSDKGVFNIKWLRETMDVDKFELVLDELTLDSNEIELERKFQIESMLVKEDELYAHNYSVSCGQGLCAVSLSAIPNDKIDGIVAKLNKLDLGSTFHKTISINDYESDVRVISQSKHNNSISFSVTGS
ncbi:MAG: hypothetical protein HRT35_23775 [Algicola sp.]|nr:hypothetical protein [Algicola sp.]